MKVYKKILILVFCLHFFIIWNLAQSSDNNETGWPSFISPDVFYQVSGANVFEKIKIDEKKLFDPGNWNDEARNDLANFFKKGGNHEYRYDSEIALITTQLIKQIACQVRKKMQQCQALKMYEKK